MRASTASRAVSIRTGTCDPAAAELSAHLEAVDARQHDIEDDGVVVGDRGLVQGVLAVSGDVDRIRLLAQPFGEHLRGSRLILDQQHPHCSAHSRS